MQDFLGKLKSYDKDNIPPKIIAVIRASYLTNENFTPDTAKKASPAAEVRKIILYGLCPSYLTSVLGHHNMYPLFHLQYGLWPACTHHTLSMCM